MTGKIEIGLCVAIAIAFVLLGTFFMAMNRGLSKNAELHSACMADGFKEWECTAMLRGGKVAK